MKWLIVSAAALLAIACSEDSAGPSTDATYLVEVSGEQFKVKVQGAAAVAALEARRQSGAEGVVIGTLEAGDGGFNSPWKWHLKPSTTNAVDMAIELCDGRPSMVQNDLDYWLGSVKSFCPWGAKIVSRIN